MASTVKSFLARAVAALENAGVPQPDVDAELLVAHVLGESRGRVQALEIMDAPLTQAQENELELLLSRRVRREPLQHITGLASFRSLELKVGPGVFVPRPETEWVTQIALDALRSRDIPHPLVVDICAGSGAIGLSIASEVPHAIVHGVEKSPLALEWALKNVERVQAANFTLHEGLARDALPALNGMVDLVISNPPYVPADAIPREPEVRDFDPAMALYGGSDGMDVLREVSLSARRLCRPGGLLVLEHGELQGSIVREILATDGWVSVETKQDLTNRDRVTLAANPQ